MLLVVVPGKAFAVDTPANVYASLGVQQSGIYIGWDAVNGATSYAIAVYEDLLTTTRTSTISIGPANAFYLNTQPCGVSWYYEVYARIDDEFSAPSPRVFGQSPPCGFAGQNCDNLAVPISGTGDYTFTTVGSQSNYRIGDRSGACTDGNDPGTAGVGPELVYTYLSPVDCTLTVTLNKEAGFLGNMYIADTCEIYACDYFSFVVNGPDIITIPVTAGQPYYIFVDGYSESAAGEYTLSLTSDDCTPATSCADVTYDFQDNALPQGWTTLDQDQLAVNNVGRYALASWGVLEDLTGLYYNRVVAAYADPDIAEGTDDWLIAGPFALGADATLIWRDARIGNAGTLGMKVYVANGPTTADFFAEGSVAALTAVDFGEAFTQRSIPLAAEGFADESVYVGFRHTGNRSGYLLLDDIGICGIDNSASTHTVDQNADFIVSLSELLRVIQFYNSAALRCQAGTEDGFAPGAGDTTCAPHQSDYSPQNWIISLSELLRVIQFYNTGGYRACAEGEDNYCPGAA
jgi:hypothetical protein